MSTHEGNALIGYTGFVGSNLHANRPFDHVFRSTDIDRIRHRSFDTLVCAGAPAVKWVANKQPDSDWANLQHLIDCIRTVTARHVVLISTVDVYPTPVDVDETEPIDPDGGEPYGRHRRRLENLIEDTFDHTVLRLPGLFGPGMKKNVIFDLLNDHRVEYIDPAAVFQFYDLTRLWSDIDVARSSGLSLVNLVTEPTSAADVARAGFDRALSGAPSATPVRYDCRTRHAELFGGTGHYVQSRDEVLAAVHDFVVAQHQVGA